MLERSLQDLLIIIIAVAVKHLGASNLSLSTLFLVGPWRLILLLIDHITNISRHIKKVIS